MKYRPKLSLSNKLLQHYVCLSLLFKKNVLCNLSESQHNIPFCLEFDSTSRPIEAMTWRGLLNIGCLVVKSCQKSTPHPPQNGYTSDLVKLLIQVKILLHASVHSEHVECIGQRDVETKLFTTESDN